VIFLLRFGGHLLSPEIVLFLKLHDVIVITFPKLFYFPRDHVICFEHNISIFSHVLFMLSLHQKHVFFLVIVTMHLVLEHLIKILICVIILE
jgi:hypothetical protein